LLKTNIVAQMPFFQMTFLLAWCLVFDQLE
jgi:hypothetical protein